MSKIIKNFLAPFLLVLFLFPQIQKGIHDFEHRHDTHCDAKAEKHFHTLEHVCSICNFSIPVSIEFLTFYFNKLITFNEIVFQIPVGNNIIADCFYKIPPRAPPVFFS